MEHEGGTLAVDVVALCNFTSPEKEEEAVDRGLAFNK